MSFSSDASVVTVPYILNRIVKTVADGIKYTAPPPANDHPSTTSGDATSSPESAEAGPSKMAQPGDSPAWKNKFKLWGKAKASEELLIEDLPDITDNTPDASTIAHRIQSLVDKLPPPDPSKRPSKVPKPVPPTRDSKGKCLPPPGSTPIKDKSLISLLSSSSVMNGEAEGRKSVWSILEKLHAHQKPNGDRGEDGEEEDDPTVMLYVPLLPTKNSTVEIASSTTTLPDVPSPESTSASQTGWWPLGRAPKDDSSKPPVGDKKVRTKAKKVWVPSATNLSFQAFWWGYKLYLPPPVLDILNDKQIEATKRAAMITTALKWLADNIPTSAVPPSLLPALLLIQRVVPFVGYIGGFIGWSWSTIKSYDEGLGVILTATWILPVALIPGTWRASDIPSTEPDSPTANPSCPPPTCDPPVPVNPPATTASKAPKANR